jgi:hypothetical protein
MNWRQLTLRVDGGFLGLVGLFQMLFEVLSHYVGIGPLADRFLNSPYTIGFFEAHGLAVFIGLLLIKFSSKSDRFWNWLAVAIHVFLGGANLLFWWSFVQLDFVLPGIIATTLHFLFFFLQLYFALKAQS